MYYRIAKLITRTTAKIAELMKIVLLQSRSEFTEGLIIDSIFLLITIIYTGNAATLRNT